MANQQLTDYIRQQLLSGMASADLRTALKAGGWTELDIDEGFTEVGRATTPLQSPQPTDGDLKPGATAGTPLPQDRSATDATSSAEPLLKTEWNPPEPSRSRRTLLVAAALVLALAGGIGVVAWYYYVEAPKAALRGMPAAMADLQAASYKISVRLTVNQISRTEAREMPDNPLGSPASLLAAAAGLISREYSAVASAIFGTAARPAAEVDDEESQFDVELRSSGAFRHREGRRPNVSSLFDISAKQGGNRYGLSAEFRTIEETMYFRLVELPLELLGPLGGIPPFGALDVSRYIKNWYSIRISTIADLKLAPEPASIDEGAIAKRQEALRRIIRGAHPFAIQSVSRGDSIGGTAVYRFTLKPKREEIIRVSTELLKADQDRNLTKTEEEQITAAAEKANQATIIAWIGAKDDLLRKVSIEFNEFELYRMRVKANITAEFSDFNTADPSAPAASISFDEELKNLSKATLFGLEDSRRKARDARRIADTKQIQLALELHFDGAGGYPAGLAKLAPIYMPEVPTDPEGDKPYAYTYRMSGGKIVGYHLGASLEDAKNAALKSDSDCNSLAGTGCITRTGFSRTSAFNGSDLKGCRGEAGRACYDVEQ